MFCFGDCAFSSFSVVALCILLKSLLFVTQGLFFLRESIVEGTYMFFLFNSEIKGEQVVVEQP
jgi:hypothetical protein